MKTFKRIYNIFVTVVVVLAVIVAMLLAGVRLFGLKPYTVLSGSMEPKYHVGSVVYVTSAVADELEIGDAITFYTNGVVVTHEIVDIDEDEKGVFFTTQGIANDTVDSTPVREGEVIGKVVLSIPLLGYLSSFLQTPYVRYAFIGGIIILLLLSLLRTSDDEQQNESEQG